MIKVLILACLQAGPCDRVNAQSVMWLPELVSSQSVCLLAGQAYAAGMAETFKGLKVQIQCIPIPAKREARQ